MSQAVAAAPETAVGGSPGSGAAPVRRRREVLAAYLLLAPAVVLILGPLAYPIAWEGWVSVFNFSTQQTRPTFIGLHNYGELLQDSAFWWATANTAGYIVLTSILKLAIGVGVALALARPFPGRPFVFLAAFLPWAYPASVALIGWYWFIIPPVHAAYSPFLAALQFTIDRWLGDGTWGFLSVVALNTWRGGSFTGIFLLAALNGIPQDVFDYAALEVRSGWRRFWMVTVPLLRPFLALATFLSFATAVTDLGNVWFQSGQRIVYPIVWTQAMQDALIGGQWGKASALSLILLPVLIVFLLACFRLFEPLEEST
ncbi:MAG TPA: sugar ABC transporter permease [bacterium]|nr:sugar ABC transporter permease [bacterium]